MGETKNKLFILLPLFLIILGFVGFIFATTTIIDNSVITRGNYSGTMNFSIYTSLNGSNVEYNVSIFYNASGGAVDTTTALAIISNTSSPDTFENASVDISGLDDASTIYNFSIYADNGTDQEWTTTVLQNITIDNTAPNVSSFVNTINYQNFSTNDTILINVSVDDSIMGVESVFLNITNSSGFQNHTFYATTGSGRWYYNSSVNISQLEEGKYNITAWANDTQLNNLNNGEEIQITIDRTAPSVSVIRSSYTKNSLTLAITASDSLTNVQTCTTDRSGASITGSGASQTLTETSLSCATSYTYVITCLDSAGNSGSTTASFSTYTCPGGSSIAGGSSGSTWKKTYAINENQFKEGISKSLRSKERIKVKIEGTYHSVGVTALTSSTATIEISSTPQTLILKSGEIQKVDVTDDNYYDLQIKLEEIANSKATIEIKSIYEAIPAQTKPQLAPEEEVIAENEGKTVVSSEEKSSLLWLWIVIFIIVVIVFWLIFSKRKKK